MLSKYTEACMQPQYTHCSTPRNRSSIPAPQRSSLSPFPPPRLSVLLRLPNGNAKRQSEEESHRSPVSQGEVLRQRIEGEVASRTFGIMVGTGEACGGGSKATAGD